MLISFQRVTERMTRAGHRRQRHRHRRALAGVLAVAVIIGSLWIPGVAAAVAEPQGAVSDQSGDQLIEISGRVSPELIPDYLVWEQLFRILVRQSLQPLPDAGSPLLNLSIAERQRVWAEAEASVAREAACEARMLDEFDALRVSGASQADIVKGTRDVVIGCRLATLDAVDAMMEALSETARFSLSAWAVDHRAGMTVVLLARDLAFFRQPR